MTILSGVIIGMIIHYIFMKIKGIWKYKNILKGNYKTFFQLKENIKYNNVKFINRINNNLTFKTNLNNYGDINFIITMDTKQILIFKKNECLLTSTLIDDELKNDIINSIYSKYENDINDVVSVLDFIISRCEFEKKMNLNNDKITKIEYNIDDILDKINDVGYNNISDDEKDFLKRFK